MNQILQFIDKMDHDIIMWVYNNLHNPILDAVFPVITKLGDAGVVWILITFIFLFNKKYRYVGMTSGIALLLSLLIVNIGLKPLFSRLRPYYDLAQIKLLINKPLGYSFPSGHSSSSFAGAIAILLVYNNRKITYSLLGLAVLIALSRVYLSVHFPSDVIIGSAVGVMCGFVAYKVVDKYYISSKKSIN